MKTIRIITQLAILASMGLTSCEDYEAGFMAADIFRGTYARIFVEKHGAIDPEETWDLSTAGGRRSGVCATRAAGTYTSVASDDGYYYLPDEQLNWMKTRLPEQTNNSSNMKPFEMFWEKGNVFEVIPIYEGYAELRWKLGIKVMGANDVILFEDTFWEKPKGNGSDNFQVIWDAEPTLAKENEISVFYETTAQEALIWAWDKDGSQIEGFNDWDNRPKMTRIGCKGVNNYVYKYTFSGSKIPTGVKFIDGNDCDLDFVNNGYYKANGGRGEYVSTISALYNVETTYKNKDTWIPFKDRDNGLYAAQFRSKPVLSKDFLDTDFPTGSKVLFYLQIIDENGNPTGEVQFSDRKQMTLLECQRPSNIPEGYKTYILGVEYESLTSNTCDRDYNDIVFLIAGKVPDPVYYTPDPYVKVTEKRYMCEDLTNTGDFDFNDIVIDVRQTYTRYFTETAVGSKDYVVDHETTEQEAKVSWLCDTVPLTAQVGDYRFPLITNPSDRKQSIDQLHSSESNYDEGNWFSGSGTTEGYCPMGEDDWVPITGWDPDANNISIFVCWDGTKATTLKDATSIEGGSKVWISKFPEKGSVPYIIATDFKDEWTEECHDIDEKTWWRDHFLWSSPTDKQSSPAN